MNTQSNADTKNKVNYPLLTREQIKGTPFYYVGNTEIGYNITWGKYKFNDTPLPQSINPETWVTENMWQIIQHLIAIGFAVSKEALLQDINKG